MTASDIADGLTNPNFTVSADGVNGSATIDAVSGAWIYTPDTNFNGTDSFTVTITDDDNNTETQVINVTVNPTNDAATITGNLCGRVNEDGGNDSYPFTVESINSLGGIKNVGYFLGAFGVSISFTSYMEFENDIEDNELNILDISWRL